MTQFRRIISQWAFHFCSGHRRLWVATGRAVKRSRLVLSHCLCVRRYNRNWKRNRFSRISLQSHHSSGPQCTCWGYCNMIQLQALRYWTIWFLIISVGGQDETNLAIWLATRVARWARARWAYLARSGFPAMAPQEKFSFWPHNKTVSDQACLLMMAAYWSCSFLRFYWVRLGHNNAKMNLANIQPSWPQEWILTWIKNLRQHVKAIKEQAIVFEYLQCWRMDPSLRPCDILSTE